jgi:hypothetical protein
MGRLENRSIFADARFVIVVMVAAMASAALEVDASRDGSAGAVGAFTRCSAATIAAAASAPVDGVLLSAASRALGR